MKRIKIAVKSTFNTILEGKEKVKVKQKSAKISFFTRQSVLALNYACALYSKLWNPQFIMCKRTDE